MASLRSGGAAIPYVCTVATATNVVAMRLDELIDRDGTVVPMAR